MKSWLMFKMLCEIKVKLHCALRYQIPPVKLSDHLSDCFGCLAWWIKPRRATSPSPYTKAMMGYWVNKATQPTTSFFVESGENPFASGETVEIDIVRGV